MTGTDITPYDDKQGRPRGGLFQAPGGDYHGSDRKFRLRLSPGVVLIYLLVIGGLLAVGWYADRRSSDERRAAIVDDVDTSGQLTDTFEPPGNGAVVPLDAAANVDGISWAPLGSGFEVAPDGTARVVAAPVGETSMALTNPGHQEITILTTVANAPQGAGLVFRFQDVFNHWSLISAPDFGTWNLTNVVDGNVVFAQAVGLTETQPGTTLAISLGGPSIRVFVDGNPVLAVADPAFQQWTTVGLIGVNGSLAAFDDFTVVVNELVLTPPADTGQLDE